MGETIREMAETMRKDQEAAMRTQADADAAVFDMLKALAELLAPCEECHNGAELPPWETDRLHARGSSMGAGMPHVIEYERFAHMRHNPLRVGFFGMAGRRWTEVMQAVFVL